MQTKVRKVKKSDLPQIGTIWAASFNKAYRWEQWTYDSALKIVSDMYKKQPDLFFLAESDGNIVGAAWCTVKPHINGNHMVDGAVFILPEYQGKGIYKKLSLVRLKEAIKRYKVTGIQILASKADEFPVSFYKRLGFEESSWILLYTNPKDLLKKLQKTK